MQQQVSLEWHYAVVCVVRLGNCESRCWYWWNGLADTDLLISKEKVLCQGLLKSFLFSEHIFGSASSVLCQGEAEYGLVSGLLSAVCRSLRAQYGFLFCTLRALHFPKDYKPGCVCCSVFDLMNGEMYPVTSERVP